MRQCMVHLACEHIAVAYQNKHHLASRPVNDHENEMYHPHDRIKLWWNWYVIRSQWLQCTGSNDSFLVSFGRCVAQCEPDHVFKSEPIKFNMNAHKDNTNWFGRHGMKTVNDSMLLNRKCAMKFHSFMSLAFFFRWTFFFFREIRSGNGVRTIISTIGKMLWESGFGIHTTFLNG